MAMVWLVGRIYALIRGFSEPRVRKFNAISLSRFLFFCDLAYAPVCEEILSLFACLPYDKHRYVSEDLRIQCGSAEYRATRKLGIIGVLLFPIGIPVAYLVCMCYFRVPHAANILERNSRLRQLVVVAHQRGIKQPLHNVSILSCTNITDDHINLLYRSIFLKEEKSKDDKIENIGIVNDLEQAKEMRLVSDEDNVELSDRERELPHNPYASFHALPSFDPDELGALEREVQSFINELHKRARSMHHSHSVRSELLSHMGKHASRKLLSHLTGALASDFTASAGSQQRIKPASTEVLAANSFQASDDACRIPPLLLDSSPSEFDALEIEVVSFVNELRMAVPEPTPTRPTDPRVHHERMLLTALYTQALLQRTERNTSMQLLTQLNHAFTLRFPGHAIDPADLSPPSQTEENVLVAEDLNLEELEALGQQMSAADEQSESAARMLRERLLTTVSTSRESSLTTFAVANPSAIDAKLNLAPASPQDDDGMSEGDPSVASEADSLEAEIREELDKLTRHQKMSRLLKWIRSKAMPVRYTWREMQDENDPRRKSVNLAIAVLYEDYFPDVWFWKLYEVSNKLAITGVLSFIAPGSVTQIIAGIGISFFSLLVFLRFLPYPKKTIRQLAYTCNVVVFLFFFVALLLRFDTTRTLIDGDYATTNTFYSIFVISMWASIPVTLIYVSYSSGDLDAILITGEEEEEDSRGEDD
jgi:hypothetical protein